jgi:succinyl-diaminopimelate desuccinylase
LDIKSFIDEKINSYQEDLINDTVKMCSIKSIKEEYKELPFGKGIKAALDFALSLGENMGFKAVNMDNYIGYVEYGEGKDYIGVLGHLDVVPEGEGWNTDPFSPVIKEGKIYARGILDDKGPVIASLYALKALKELGIKPNKKIRIIFGLDEESQGDDVTYYNERERPPLMGFTPDGNFPVVQGEKGLATFLITKKMEKISRIAYMKGGIRSNMVPEECQVRLILRDGEQDYFKKRIREIAQDINIKVFFNESKESVNIKTFGRSAHASRPYEGVNAVSTMFRLLSFLLEGDGDDISFIKFIANYIGEETNGESLGINFIDSEWGELTLNVGLAFIEKEEIGVKVNIRYPGLKSLKDIIEKIEEKAVREKIIIKSIKNNPPLYFDEKSPLISELMKAYNLYENGGKPIIIGGSTFAKSMENIVAYGPIFLEKENTAHEPNENMKIENLIKCSKIHGNALYKLSF